MKAIEAGNQARIYSGGVVGSAGGIIIGQPIFSRTCHKERQSILGPFPMLLFSISTFEEKLVYLLKANLKIK